MKENKNIRFWLMVVCLALMAISYSCTDDLIDNSDGNYPISLSISVDDGSSIRLDWTSTQVSTFDRYIIVRSTEPISDSISPMALISVAEIEDLDETFFEDSGYPVADEIYYKVFADIGDHLVFSPTVVARPNLQIFDARFADAEVDTDKNELFILDQNTQRIIRYNYITEEVAFADLDWFPSRIKYLQQGDESELYVYAINNFQYDLYDPTSMTKNRSVFMDRAISYILPSISGYTYISNRSSTQNLYVVDQADHSVFRRHSLRQNTDFSTLAFIDAEQKIIVEASRQELGRYKMSISGNVVDRKNENVGFRGLANAQVVSPDGQFIFPFSDFSLFNRDLEEISNQDNIFFQTKVFSEGGTRVFGSTGSNAVTEFEFPSLNQIKEHPLIAQPIFMFADERKIFIVEQAFNNLGESKIVIQNINF